MEIADFVRHAPVAPEVVEAYRSRVPAELVELWERYGCGTFARGFIRVIDPQEYEAALAPEIRRTQGDDGAVPVMVTGFGDLITWEPRHDGLVAIVYREARAAGLGSLGTLVTMTSVMVPTYMDVSFSWGLFPAAVEAHGALPFTESFVVDPPTAAIDDVAVANLRKRDTIASIRAAVNALSQRR